MGVEDEVAAAKADSLPANKTMQHLPHTCTSDKRHLHTGDGEIFFP